MKCFSPGPCQSLLHSAPDNLQGARRGVRAMGSASDNLPPGWATQPSPFVIAGLLALAALPQAALRDTTVALAVIAIPLKINGHINGRRRASPPTLHGGGAREAHSSPRPYFWGKCPPCESDARCGQR